MTVARLEKPTEVGSVSYTHLKQGTPFFIIAAVVAQLCKYLAQGRGFQACFNTVNGHIS